MELGEQAGCLAGLLMQQLGLMRNWAPMILRNRLLTAMPKT